MRRIWRYFRLLFLGVAFLALGAYLFAFTPWRRQLGWTPTYDGQLAQGDPLVDALYRFHHDRGLWPEYLDDLAPQFLPHRPSPIWNYQVTPTGPQLATSVDTRTALGYDFDAHNWRVAGLLDNRTLRAAPATSPATLPAALLLSRQLAELDRRIAREPEDIQHWQAKAALLHAADRDDDARAVIAAAQSHLPDHPWPRLAAALLGDAADLDTFAQWVREHPSFTHSYALALAYRLRGKDPAALDALREGLLHPPTVADEDAHILAFYLFDEARYALQRGEWKLAIALTTAWQAAADSAPQTDYLPLRAAARLAAGDFDGAAADLAALDDRKPPAWAQHVDALRDAVRRRDAAFRYDPGNRPPADAPLAIPP